ncbi:CPBP family intramembrane glutamic endopeptidase [Halovivax sp.]|uniref:CPBP family intramembrane glutamic endopeptidase n=1 Tax=Halovivax sp. TaxID=1935978 RepID=UPI0025BB76A9|nr:CPBP family intramembrane glutamic endopeptidase [Halovivax sp.]
MSDQQTVSSGTRDGRPLRAVLVAFGLTLFGILVAELTTLPVVALEPALFDEPAEATIGFRTAFFVLNFVGMAAAGAIYLSYTDRGWEYVDLRIPTRRDWLFAGLGIVASLLLYVAAVAAIALGNLPAADSGVVQFVGDDVRMIPILIAIAFLFNAPAEEFLFRNVIQKRLYDAFDRPIAVIVASAIFAIVHAPVFAVFADSALAVAVPLTIVFGGGVIFGYVYAVTDNLVVPTLAHAVYNSFIWVLLYLSMTGVIDEVETPADALATMAGLAF